MQEARSNDEHDGVQGNELKRLRELEKKNTRLKKVLSRVGSGQADSAKGSSGELLNIGPARWTQQYQMEQATDERDLGQRMCLAIASTIDFETSVETVSCSEVWLRVE